MADEAKPEDGGTPAPEDGGTPVPPAAESGKTFTQAELDAIVQDRLARERKKAPAPDELKELRDAKARLDEIEQAGASELEKANAAREKAEAKAAEAVTRANERLIRADAIAELAKQGVTNVEGALRALDKTGLTVEDDGTVSGVEEAVKGLLETIPEFVGKVVPTKVDQGARGTSSSDGQVTAAQLETMSAEEIARATRQGRMKDLLG